MSSESTRLRLPGWTLPLNYKPSNREDGSSPDDDSSPEDDGLFPHALDYADVDRGDTSRITVHRELVMLRVMNSITDKPEWERKVFDEEIMTKWREEISRSGEDVTKRMMNWITKELQWKADVLHKTGIVVALEPGVVKSDTAVPKDVQQALKEAVQPLEDVPEEQKDYHPNSDNQVLDLVHPSLFPVIYGRSRILSDRLVGCDDCFCYIGQGEVLKEPPLEEKGLQDTYQNWYSSYAYYPFSGKFQWMPCDVKFTEEGGCRIASYINNLHPQKNRGLYGVIEQIIAQTIPLWDVTLTHVKNEYKRIEYYEVNYLDHLEPEPVEEDSDDYWVRYREWESTMPIELPEPGEFEPSKITPRKKINLREGFAETGFQVIVKLANIELTPEKPEYNGGSWHVEGQLNEHICASAVYYYDIENITESNLSFRQRAGVELSAIGYDQDRHDFLQSVYGFSDDIDGRNPTDVTQYIGSVSTTEGRLITFPNMIQHQVSPFSLADRSRPGHRKILALFLVDPHLPIISSANIPPQQEDWWKERDEVLNEVLGLKLPTELQYMVRGYMDVSPITLEEAKKYRLELMEERRMVEGKQNEHFVTYDFNLCEH